MSFVNGILDKAGEKLADILARESSGYEPFTPSDPETLERVLRPGDVLLVEGNQKISSGIKYLTQSTWSHAALYVGDALEDQRDEDGKRRTLIEVNLGEGCVAVALDKYECFNTRICRPVGLTREDRKKVVDFMVGSIGLQYDMRNIVDLARFLMPTPPVPLRWRRRMIAIGSGEPTRAICSTLIAQAFQSVRYPMLPRVERVRKKEKKHGLGTYTRREILHIRHHSLFAPRDFDLSPYFRIVKPTVEHGFDYKQLVWGRTEYPADLYENGHDRSVPVLEHEEGAWELDQADVHGGQSDALPGERKRDKKSGGKGHKADTASGDESAQTVRKSSSRRKNSPPAHKTKKKHKKTKKAKKNDRAMAVNSGLYAFSRASFNRFTRDGHRASGQKRLYADLFGSVTDHVRLAVQRFWARGS